MSRFSVALTLVLALALAGCAGTPRIGFDPASGLLARDDGAYDLRFSQEDQSRWQLEVPGAGGAPARFPFDYDAILYLLRRGRGMLAPEAALVLVAFPYPEGVKAAASLAERNERLFVYLKQRLAAQGFPQLAESDEQFLFDGRTLTTSLVNPEEPLSEPQLGSAFVFGARYVLQAIYELYPPSGEEPMSEDEIREALGELAALLADARVS